MGHKITGTWLQESAKPEVLSERDWQRQLAVKDLAECAAADCIILDLDGTSSTGGRYVEWGFALGRFDMLKVTVGADDNGVFNRLADLHFKDWDELLTYFKETY
jgi:nucleoside 2-deoxyribosyltransferase